MNKIVVGIVVVLVLAGGGWYFYGQKAKEAKAPTEETKNAENAGSDSASSPSPTPVTPPAPSPTPSQGTFSAGIGAEVEGPDISVVEISYDGFAFSPSSVNIKVGDYVLFRNKSQDKFWPASNPHPIHDDYSAFDPKKPIDAGGKWQFQFNQAGAWKFHDHLNPAARGVVNVTAR